MHQKEKKILVKNFLGKKLAKKNLCKWHNLNEKKIKKLENLKNKFEKNQFF